MEELIDVLTPDGTPTGARKTKSEIHRDGDWHRAAHVWIITTDSRVVLQLRSTRKTNYPGMWDVSSAGHVSAGESAIEAGVRETREEIGIAIAPDDLRWIGTFREQRVLRGGTYIDNEIHEVYLVRRDVAHGEVTLDPTEVDDIQFVPIAEFVERVKSDPTLVPHRDEYELLLKQVTRSRGFEVSRSPK